MPVQESILAQAEQAFDTAYAGLCAKLGKDSTTGSWIAAIGAAFIFCIVLGIGFAATIVAWILAHLGAQVADSFVKAISDIRNAPSDAFNSLIVDTLGEFFGASFNTDNLSATPGEATNLANMQAIGGDIWSLLEGEFAPDGELTATQGLTAAQAFAGFATNFAVRSAFLGIIGEVSSWGIVQDFREIGEDVARNLGLGRLVRRALQPLVNVTITQPLQWYLNQKYRPKLLPDELLLKGYNAGSVTDAHLAQSLQYMGYQDTDIAIIQSLFGDRYGAAEAFTLFRYKVLDHDSAISRMRLAGINLDAADEYMVELDCARADYWVRQYVNQVTKAYVAGQLDDTTFQGFIEAAPLGDIEKQWIYLTYQQEAKIPHRKLSIGQLESALEYNVITVDEFETYLAQAGFDTDDAFVILQLTLIKQQKMEAAAAKAAAKAKKAAAATGATPTPTPPTTGTTTT